jgi:hypothetical protein
MKKTKNIKNVFLLGMATMGAVSGLNAQQGYIYLHMKALDESSSPDFTYSVSGGSTTVPTIQLNDQPAQLQIGDLGAAQNGRLWAVGRNNHTLYYRDVNNAAWVATSITNASNVDGGQNGNAYYLTTGGQVMKTIDGTSSTAISGNINAIDIGSGWDDRPYIVTAAGKIQRYDGAGSANTDWTLFSSSSLLFNYVDVQPLNGSVYVTASNATNNFAYRLTPNAINGDTAITAPLSIGRGGVSGLPVNDIAVNEQGEIYTVMANTASGTWGIYKWISGTAWTPQEVTSLEADRLTGGVGNQMWTTKKLGGILSATVPYFNIYSRSLAGSTISWIDDERVRTVTKGNSVLIPVAAGTYTVTQALVSGWDLQGFDIADPGSNSSGNVSSRTATINVTAGEVVHVTFQNGIVNPFTMTNSCANVYLENFGTGATGTFGSAFVGQTSYHYIGTSASGEDGNYKVVSNAFPDFNTWQTGPFYDHTTGNGTGRMFAVNAGYDRNEFFRRRFIGVTPGATYNFSAWLANLTPGTGNIRPNVSFQIINPANGTVLATYSTGDLPGPPTAWTQYGMSFVATTAEIDLVLVNNTIGGNGNDLAIDDITFQLTPPAAAVTTKVPATAGNNGSITVTSPIGSAIQYSLDGVTYQSSPAFSALSAGVYTVYVRFATTPDCITQSSDTVNTAISGSVYNDENGISDNSINGNLLTSAISGAPALYMSLYKGTTLIQTVPVNMATGTYQFTQVPPNTTCMINIGTSAAANPSSSFAGSGSNGWVATGEICCGTTGSDALANGSLTINVTNSAVSGANFGLDRRPLSNNVSQTTAYPVGNAIAAGAVTTNVSGTDGEQGSLNGNNAPVIISTLPANAVMKYNGVQKNTGDTIVNFIPSLLSFSNITTASTQVIFNYSFYDHAGLKSLTAASYTITWGTPLPILLSLFEAHKQESTVLLNWQTASEEHNKGFGIERSADGKDWYEIGFQPSLAYNGNSNNPIAYHFNDSKPLTGINYYRLKQIELDDNFVYSTIRQVLFGTGSGNVSIFPNPTSGSVRIAGLNGGETVSLINVTGQCLLRIKATMHNETLDLQQFSPGAYFIVITDQAGNLSNRFKIVKK